VQLHQPGSFVGSGRFLSPFDPPSSILNWKSESEILQAQGHTTVHIVNPTRLTQGAAANTHVPARPSAVWCDVGLHPGNDILANHAFFERSTGTG
jgi:hypothetical protein